MYRNYRVLCVIPARGGSKGLPDKNIKELAGKPLIAYTIEQAKQSQYSDKVIVSTDSPKIAEVSQQFGAKVPFIRPAELATDEVGSMGVLLHALEWLEIQKGDVFDIVVLLQATSPLRNTEDIDNCISVLVEREADSIFSVVETHANPYFTLIEREVNGKLKPVKNGIFPTRQSVPSVFAINGAVYVWWTDVLQQQKRTLLPGSEIYIMPKERSVDIDDLIDFKMAEFLLKEKISHGSYN